MTVGFEHVGLSYGSVQALTDLSTEFEPGLNVVLGPNGAGKTTLFRVGAGILPPDEGSVSIEGTDPFVDHSVKSRIGYLPHGTPLNPELTVEENLEYWGRIIGLDRDERTERIARTSESAGVTELLDRKATDLSRGQRQRTIVARLLLGEPTVLFLDEPTTGLDPTAAKSLRTQLDDLAAEGRTLCYSTHNLYEAELLADELTIVQDGAVLAKGPKEELVSRLKGGDTRAIHVVADARQADFESIGVEARQEPSGWIVTLPADRTVGELVADLVEAGVTIERVQEEDASLEELYDRLTVGER